MSEVEWLDWHDCYSDRWQGVLTPESMAHPAKAARGLLRRTFEHMESQGWLPPGSRVFDPFGGVSTTAVEGASRGLHVTTLELEPRFSAMGLANAELHRRVWEASGDPLPVILCGDSRKAAEIVRGHFAATVGSPPFSGTEQPCASQTQAKKDYHAFTRGNGTKRDATMTGDTPGQLGGMPSGDIQSVISSPPYGGNEKADYLMSEDGKTRARDAGRGFRQGTGCFRNSEGAYGQSDGQLGGLPTGDVDTVISSPPYEETAVTGERNFQSAKCPDAAPARDCRNDGYDAAVSSPPYENEQIGSTDYIARMERLCNEPFESLAPRWQREVTKYRREKKPTSHCQLTDANYGKTAGQIGNNTGETFWSAARQILEQVHLLLKPGGVCAWVVKAYVKNGKIVDFPGNWEKLCHSTGFETVCKVRAWLTKTETNPGLFGEVSKTTAHKSFFRRMAESKGSPPIDFEVVFFVRKK